MTRNETLANPFLWLSAAVGVGAGLCVARVAELPDRWVAAAVAGAVVAPAILMARRPGRAALVLFAFSLQIGLVLYLTEPPPSAGVGFSWPTSLALPLGSLTGLAALALVGRRPLRSSRSIAISTGLLALTTAASIFGSQEPFIGFCHVVLVLAYFVIFLAAANAVQDEDELELVRRVLLATLVLQCLIYFLQVLLGGTFTATGEWIEQPDAALRYGGTVGERPATFSSFLLPLLLLAAADFLTGSDHRLRRGGLIVLGAVTLILTLTRASWMGFALGLLYLLAACARRRISVRRNAGLLAIMLLAVMAALAPKIWTRATEGSQGAFEERRALVEMALRVARAHPLTGVGAGAYSFVFRDYLSPDLADDWLYVVHNVYALRAAETGLPGLAALLIFLCVAFRLAAPERMRSPCARRMALGWRAGLIALAWEMLWDMSLGPATNSLLWFFCGLMVAAQCAPGVGRTPQPMAHEVP